MVYRCLKIADIDRDSSRSSTLSHLSKDLEFTTVFWRHLALHLTVVSITASHGNGPGSIPGPGIVHLWFCVLLNEVTPRRSDGTLNRGLVCVAHQAWTIKIPTSLRKRICDCRLIQIPCKHLRSASLTQLVGNGIHASSSPGNISYGGNKV